MGWELPLKVMCVSYGRWHRQRVIEYSKSSSASQLLQPFSQLGQGIYII
jgi:hypothetical protein